MDNLSSLKALDEAPFKVEIYDVGIVKIWDAEMWSSKMYTYFELGDLIVALQSVQRMIHPSIIDPELPN